MAELLPRLLLLQLLLLTPALSFNFTLERVLADESEGGRIVSLQYWHKFLVFMDGLNEADFGNRTEMLTLPDISDFLVPAELLSAVSASLNSSRWLRQLGAEYSSDGEHNMTLLMETLQELGQTAEEHQVTVPQEVLKQLLWRGLVRPEQQHTVGGWLRGALQVFFDSPRAMVVQRDDPTLFVEYILGVFEFDWLPIEDLLEDTLMHHHLRADLAAEVRKANSEKAGSSQEEEHGPPDGDHDDPSDAWDEFPADRSHYAADGGHSQQHEGDAWIAEGHLSDGVLSPIWEDHEAGKEVKKRHNGSVEDESWHDEGYARAELPEAEGSDVVDMFSSSWQDFGTGKGVREAHHDPAEEDVKNSEGQLGSAESEDGGPSLKTEGNRDPAEEDVKNSEGQLESAESEELESAASEDGGYVIDESRASSGEDPEAWKKVMADDWPEDYDDDANFVEEDHPSVKQERDAPSKHAVSGSGSSATASEEKEQSEENDHEYEDHEYEEEYDDYYEYLEEYDVEGENSTAEEDESEKNEDVNGDENTPEELKDSSEEVDEPGQKGNPSHHEEKPVHKEYPDHHRGKPAHVEGTDKYKHGHVGNAHHHEDKPVPMHATGAGKPSHIYDAAEGEPSHKDDAAEGEPSLIDDAAEGEPSLIDDAAEGEPSLIDDTAEGEPSLIDDAAEGEPLHKEEAGPV